MNDLISRRAAIDIVEFECGAWIGLARTIADRFKQLPSAEPEQKTGKWIGDKCSVCGAERAWYGCNPKYCPDCGAKMEDE